MRARIVRLLCLLLPGFALTACDSRPDTTAIASPAIDFYATPPLAVRQLLLAANEVGNPRELRLFLPEKSGDYPLLQFQHGFVSDVDNYTQLLARLAGFGFVIAAPQMYGSDPSSAPTVAAETVAVVEVLTWVQGNLDAVLAQRLPPGSTVRIVPANTGLLGHSRGGQVAWRMIFDGRASARAIAGVDPVDGNAPPFPPGGTGELVTDDPGAFNFPFPSLILGMGLGNSGVPGFECAPAIRNYRLFYDASPAPRYEVVARDYGHNDMTNGDTPDGVCFGAIDGTRSLLRVFVAGQLAAYFTSVLSAQPQFAILKNLGNAPVAAAGRFEEPR